MMDLPETYRDVLRQLLEANPPNGEFVAQLAGGGVGGHKLQPKGSSGSAGERPAAVPVSDTALAELVRLEFLSFQSPGGRHGYVTLAGQHAATGQPSATDQPPQLSLSTLRDHQLRARCQDLLAAGAHYDRVVREACVVLEDRVRTVAGLPRATTGTPLMEQAFSPQGGPLQLSPDRNEQVGAMQLYRGTMAFFRNVAGHHLLETWTQDDALRFVGWIDLLLTMLDQAQAQNMSAPP